MAITQAVCTSFKQELMRAAQLHPLDRRHVFKIALFTSPPRLSAADHRLLDHQRGHRHRLFGGRQYTDQRDADVVRHHGLHQL